MHEVQESIVHRGGSEHEDLLASGEALQDAVARFLVCAFTGDAGVPKVVGLVYNDGVGALGDLFKLSFQSRAVQVGMVEDSQAGEDAVGKIGHELAEVSNPHGLARRLGDEQDDVLFFVSDQAFEQHQANEGLTQSDAVA